LLPWTLGYLTFFAHFILHNVGQSCSTLLLEEISTYNQGSSASQPSQTPPESVLECIRRGARCCRNRKASRCVRDNDLYTWYDSHLDSSL
jgi:hypothetical protein